MDGQIVEDRLDHLALRSSFFEQPSGSGPAGAALDDGEEELKKLATTTQRGGSHVISQVGLQETSASTCSTVSLLSLSTSLSLKENPS